MGGHFDQKFAAVGWRFLQKYASVGGWSNLEVPSPPRYLCLTGIALSYIPTFTSEYFLHVEDILIILGDHF